MNVSPLRVAYAGATLLTLAWAPAAARAHVDVQPRLVEQGAETTLLVELPQLRAGPPPTRLEVSGEGVTVLASTARAASGAESLWNVRLQVGPTTPPGELLLILRGVFPDGESVEVDGFVTVVPPPPGAADPFPWPWIALGTALALAAAGGVLLAAARRRS
jgi:hypothetical protein